MAANGSVATAEPDQAAPEGGGIRDEIARLETRIAAQAESIERCRKIALGSRLVLMAGAAWIVLILLRVIPFEPFNIVGAISAMLGGTVLFGSNSSTWKQTVAAMQQAEAQRASLIDSIEMQTVGEAAWPRIEAITTVVPAEQRAAGIHDGNL